MSRRDYILLAAIIETALDDGRNDLQTIGRITGALVRTLAADNEAFDQGRFLAACGLDEAVMQWNHRPPTPQEAA